MFDPMHPFTRATALAAGVTDEELRGSSYRQLIWGVHVSASVTESARLLAQAALLVHPPSAVVSHLTAAAILGAPTPTDPEVHVTVPRKSDRRQRQGLRCHIGIYDETEVRVLDGLRVSSACRMFVELAGLLPLVELVVLGDWLVRRRHVTIDELTSYCARSNARRAPAARAAAAYVRDRVDSPMETRLRMLIVLAGLPEPEVNVWLSDENGRPVIRVDLSWPQVKLAVEYDGRHHVEVLGEWEHDAVRRDDLPRGWRSLTVTSKGMYQQPEVTLERIRRALEGCGWRPAPRLGHGWRRHFGR